MKQPVIAAQDSTLLVTTTVGQLRELVRDELHAIVADAAKSRIPGGDKGYFTMKEAAACSGLGASTIRLHIRHGRLAVQRVGRRILIKRSDLDFFLQSETITT
jgi:excisionase family DNA binding protein